MDKLIAKLKTEFNADNISIAFNEITLEVVRDDIVATCKKLRDEFNFDTLIDLCGVDYLVFNKAEWQHNASDSGFGRARFDINDNASELLSNDDNLTDKKKRFAVVYHLLSTTKNYRLRVKTYLAEDNLFISSIVDIYSSANWYEREAFDLFGFLFEGHNDLRRILTDYGFIGHPLRKDFPMIGEVEMIYDEKLGKVVYQPVSIKPNISVPKVIRDK